MQLSQVKKFETDKKLNVNKVNQPSELTRDLRMDVIFLDTDNLEPYELQARKVFDDTELEDLASTIVSHGIRNPLTVIRPSGDKQRYQIISGERRWRAAKIAGLRKVPCIINDNNMASQEIALIENIQRKDLSPVELLEGLESYIANNPNMPKEEAIKKLGISKAHFYRILSLMPLSQEARNVAVNKQISIEKLVQIAKAPEENQVSLINNQAVEKLEKAENQSLNEVFNRAINKKSKVLEIKIKKDQIESDTNFYVLSESNKKNIVLLLKRFIAELEGVEGDE